MIEIGIMDSLGAALLGLPMLAYPERSEPPPIEEARDSPVRQSIVFEALVLSACSVAAIMLTASQGLALLDIGVSLPVVGIESGIATTLATAMIFSAAISDRATLSRQIAWCTIAVGVAASLLIAALVYLTPKNRHPPTKSVTLTAKRGNVPSVGGAAKLLSLRAPQEAAA